MKRLRVFQQISIVVLFAVIVPMVTIGLIISNVSQQSVRRELNYSVTQISRYIADGIQRHILNSDKEFSYIAMALKDMPTNSLKKNYLNEIEKKSLKYKNFKILPNSVDTSNDFEYSTERKSVQLYAPIDSNKVLSGEVELSNLDKQMSDHTNNFMQSIFIFDNEMTLVASNSKNLSDIEWIIKALPKERTTDEGVLFSKIKNQPLAYYQLTNPEWTVVVMTHPSVTKNTIDKARGKIILSLLLATGFIIFTSGLYIYYLYINIRQLFKGITAISKGSYDRKIRLLKSIFTPHEVVFLEKEFNYMTQKVSQAYSEISEKNLELKRLNEYRDSLVSAISHEFRTPLTSIIGYTSRLMRHDIVIDENMKQKSLYVIKDQAQRLSRMIDDLLTVPDIESFHLTISPDYVDLEKVIELCIEYVNTKNVQFEIDREEKINKVFVDYDRLIQIVVNLLDNAVKYNLDEEPIKISMKNIENTVQLKISNKSQAIDEATLQKLFEKFVRLDSELTRTTRGTGLGLYIVKGLCDAMNVKLVADNNDGFFNVILGFENTEKINA